MLQSFVSAMFPWMIAVHVLSAAATAGVLALFFKAQRRRKHLVQTLAVTADDDDEAMRQWVRTERGQRRLAIRYVVSTLTIAVVSTALFSSLPHWL